MKRRKDGIIMKKKLIERTIAGLPIGIAIGQIITVIISLIKGDGEFYACVPGFTAEIGNEAYAVALQTLLCGVMGMVFAAASVIWEWERLSIAAQTGLCFGIYALCMLPTAYFAKWMEHSVTGILGYCGIFAASFVFVWLVQFVIWRIRLNKINEKLKAK